MGRDTEIIIIADKDAIELASSLASEYGEFVELPRQEGIAAGAFRKMPLEKFIDDLQAYFHPTPIYRETERDEQFITSVQTNKRDFKMIQLFIKDEHDAAFWLCNIRMNEVERLQGWGVGIW